MVLEQSLRLAHPIIPFITEEIWQQFKPIHGNDNASIMISEYPDTEDLKESKEEKSIEWVKEIVSGIRHIRGEMKIKPSLKISALLQKGNKIDKERIKEFEYLISELSGLSSINWVATGKETPPSAINFHKNLKVLLPLEGLIQPKKEKMRLEKNKSKLTKENEFISRQLNNKKFSRNAPANLIKEQKNRFKEVSKQLNLLSIQIEEIQKLF